MARPEQVAESVMSPAGNPLLDLQAALEAMQHLTTVAESASASSAVKGPARVIQITGQIQAVIEEEPLPPIPTLPLESRDAFEVLRPDCARAWAEAQLKLRGRLVEERARWEASGRRLFAVAVTSPRRGGGRSTAARNLAACLGKLPGANVLLVDGDVEQPSLARRLRTEAAPGLGEGWRDFVRRVPETGLHVLPLGRAAGSSSIDAVDQRQLGMFIDGARANFDWLILDTPPMETASGEAIVAKADGAVLVLRNGREYFDEAGAAVRRIDPQRLAGAILNFAR